MLYVTLGSPCSDACPPVPATIHYVFEFSAYVVISELWPDCVLVVRRNVSELMNAKVGDAILRACESDMDGELLPMDAPELEGEPDPEYTHEITVISADEYRRMMNDDELMMKIRRVCGSVI